MPVEYAPRPDRYAVERIFGKIAIVRDPQNAVIGLFEDLAKS